MLLDKNSIIVLMALAKAIGNSGYKVIEKSELLDTTSAPIDRSTFNIALVEFANNGYIKMKYNDTDEFCACLNDIAKLRVKELETVELSRLSKSAIIESNASGETIITTMDNSSPIIESDIQPSGQLVVAKPKKQMGRVAVFFSGMFGGILGSGIVAAVYYLLQFFNII